MAKLSELVDTDYLPAPEPIPANIPRVYVGGGNDPVFNPGNIDLYNRPVVKNDDGTISTVKSKSFNFDGKEILIPTVADDGSKLLSDDEAVAQFRKTGKHLGEFKTPEEANTYAEKLHKDQEKYYSNQPSAFSSKVDKIINSLFRDDSQRYQLWPEKVIREGLTGAGDVASGKVPTMAIDPETGDVHTSPQMIEKAQAISALAGTGGLGGVTDATLGATPFLRPALKYKDRLYKGKEGQQHMDVIPDALYPEFQKMAMSGEDISHYNFGFVNDKGHFLNREDALKYGIDTGLIDPQAGKFGALTSTLMADSSKPGTAIEAMAKTQPKFDFSVGESSGSKSVKIGPTEITYGVNPKNNDVELSLIRTDKSKRGEGYGREAIQQFISEADNSGKRVLLNADPMDKTTSKAKLEDFYKSLGFVRNSGRNKDFTTRAEYIRNPILKADSSKESAAIQAIKEPFYSALEHNVAKINQSKMTGEQWLGTLSNKPGVKPEELQWTGLQDFLKENGNKPVTKAQIEEHLAGNKVELKEVSKGGGDVETLARKLAEEENGVGSWDRIGGGSQEHYWRDAERQLKTQRSETKYNRPDLVLHGGENYREMLLTLPNKSQRKDFNNFHVDQSENGDWVIKEKNGKIIDTISEHITDDPNEAIRLALQKNEPNTPYLSSHWDEPNILAHVRMNDRTIDGKKALHLEEIQSDWHQQGRDKGYRPEQEKKLAELVKQREDLQKEASALGSSDTRYKEIYKELPTIQTKINKIGSGNVGVPDAPFKKTWHELALKRMIREAAEKGYDRLSWTPGEAQAARYDLSKQVDKIAVPMVNESGTRSVRIDSKDSVPFKLMVDKNGKVEGHGISSDQFSGKHLSDVVGKEMAEKIMKLDKPHEFSGEGLKIGGEGMKGFYDKMIPQALEKLGKEHGVRVKSQQVETHKGFPENISVVDKNGDHVKDFKTMDAARAYLADPQNGVTGGRIKGNKAIPPKTEPVHYIDLPQSLKDQAMHKGFPLFSSTHMFTPVDHEPEFKKKK